MNRKSPWYLSPSRFCSRGAAILVLTTGWASDPRAGSLAEMPLFFGLSAQPTVMLAVDDSESLLYEQIMETSCKDGYNIPVSATDSTSILGPGVCPQLYYLFPDGGSNNTSKNQYLPPLPQFADARAPAANRAYFDPTVTYKPWTSYVNAKFQDIDPTKAAWYPNNLRTNKYGIQTFDLTQDFPVNTTVAPITGTMFNTLFSDPAIRPVSSALANLVKIPAGTTIYPSTSVANYNTTDCQWNGNSASHVWCTTKKDGTVRDNSLGIRYYLATFYLPAGTPAPKGYSSYMMNVCGKPPFGGTAFQSWDGKLWDKYEIRSSCFTDQAEYKAAMQNFANWFGYHRRREFSVKNAIAGAFQGFNNLRLGHFKINFPPTNKKPDKLPIINLKHSSKVVQFNDEIYGFTPGKETPIKQAVDFMGQQFGRTEACTNEGTVNEDCPPVKHACQKNAGILVTDGPYSDGPASSNTYKLPGPADGSGCENPRFCGKAPFLDSSDNTLADIAMKYYVGPIVFKTPRGVVPVPSACLVENHDPGLDCNAEQHMNFHTIQLGLSGLNYNPKKPVDPYKTNPQWPVLNDTITNDYYGNSKLLIDDVWHATINGRGRMFSANKSSEVRDQLVTILNSIVNDKGSAASVAANSSYVTTNSLIYQASFDSTNWTGDLAAFRFQTGNIDVSNPVWRASTALSQMTPSQRNIYTYNSGQYSLNANDNSCTANTSAVTAGQAVPFLWNNLDCNQQGLLNTDLLNNNVVDTLGVDRLNFLRGDTSKEERNGGIFRNRLTGMNVENLLGDFVNSAPAVTGIGDYGFDILPGREGADYIAYLQRKSSQTPVVFVGGNDGMLHGFNGSEQGSSAGAEVFAYVPDSVYSYLSLLPSSKYSASAHRYFVDGSIRIADAYLNGGWKSILIGTTGAGGRGLFAIDVTNPTALDASSILWDLAPTSTTPNTNDKLAYLGHTLPEPVLVRTHSTDYPWLVVVANGYNSPNGQADLIFLDPLTGNIVNEIHTYVGGNLASGGLVEKNGLSSPITVDIDHDRIADYIYAGDLEGNLWKFDITSSSYQQWRIAYGSASNPSPVFVACSTASSGCSPANRQPITSKPQVAANNPNYGGMMVLFGTGKYFELGDNDVTSTTPQLQTFYGVWDQNTGGSSDIVSGGKNQLTTQTILDNSFTPTTTVGTVLRITSSNPVDYATKRGWYLDLLGTDSSGNLVRGERVVSNPVYHGGRITFASFVPSGDPCNYGGNGWVTELGSAAGGRIQGTVPVFDIDNNGSLRGGRDLVNISGSVGSPSAIQVSGIPSATHIIRDSDYLYRINSLSNGDIKVFMGQPDPSLNSRISWRQLR